MVPPSLSGFHFQCFAMWGKLLRVDWSALCPSFRVDDYMWMSLGKLQGREQFSGKRDMKRTSIKGKGLVCDTWTDGQCFLSCQLFSSIMETSIPCSHAAMRGLQLQQCFESFLFSNSCFPKEMGLVYLIAETDKGNWQA